MSTDNQISSNKTKSTTSAAGLSSSAKKVLAALKKQGASFFSDLLQISGLLRTQVEDGLGELVAKGIVTSDSFAGLRALITPESKKASNNRNRRRRGINNIDQAGRWSIIPDTNEQPNEVSEDRISYIANVLLKRYGVVFRKLLDKEPGLPPWRDLLYVFRRLEAQGQIRGGRFVESFSGEQFALPEAIGLLRKEPHPELEEQFISISASDPLNLTSIITSGDRVPSTSGNRVLYRNGIPLATSIAGNINFLQQVDSVDEWEIRNALIKHQHKISYSEMPDSIS